MKKTLLLLAFSFTILNCAQTTTRDKAKEGQQESLFVDIPDKNDWKITYENYEKNKLVILLEQYKDTTETNPSAYLAITSEPGLTDVDPEKEMKQYFKTIKSQSADAKLTVIEQNERDVDPYVLFLAENTYNKDRKQKEAVVSIYLQGGQSFHTCSVSMEQIAFTKEQLAQKISMLKTCKTVYK